MQLYNWDEALQGFILASFYIGYTITHIPGGIIASKYGGKYILLLGMAISSLFTLLTPLFIQIGGAKGLIFCRITIGAGEGVIYPACTALLASWVPLKERTKIGTLTYSGTQLGSIFSSLVSGSLLDSYDGFNSVFYFFGFFGVLWVIVFVSYNQIKLSKTFLF